MSGIVANCRRYCNQVVGCKIVFFFVLLWRCDPTRVMAPSFLRFLDHTQRRTTVGRTPLDEWSARRRDLYLSTHNTHNRQTSMPSVGFEPPISAGERPQIYALDRATAGTGCRLYYVLKLIINDPDCTVWIRIVGTGNNKMNRSLWCAYERIMVRCIAPLHFCFRKLCILPENWHG
jgi:hypothetical protein